MKSFLKRLLGKRDCNMGQAEGTPRADQTEVGATCAASLPRVQELVSGDWENGSPSHGGSRMAPPGSHSAAGRAVVEGSAVRYRIGDRIGGRYEVLDIFGGPGKSGMGVVYKCFDRRDRRVCVLKSFQDRFAVNVPAMNAFRREAELWIALGHHPHIVAARTIRKPDGRLYLVLECIEPDDHGRNCLNHYFTGHALSLAQMITWGIQFCWGMEHAVAHGVRCHRDIKPDNIMIDREGRLKITDFGLATALDGLSVTVDVSTPHPPANSLNLFPTRYGSTCGTPPWMPPEQFGGAANANISNDIYSFGVVLFQMASGGRLPFQAQEMRQYACLHATAPVPRLGSPLASVIERCLAKRPKDRYRDFSALRADLEIHAADAGMEVPGFQELPETTERLKDWAASLCCLRRYKEAVAFADRSVAKDPQHAPAWINRSVCYLHLNEPSRARESALQAIKLRPGDAFAWNNLACANWRLGRWDEAFEAAERAVDLDSGLIDGWNTLGDLYHSTEDFKNAVKCYSKAVEIDSFFFDGWMNLAASYCSTDEFDQTLRCYERAVRIDPNDGDATERRDAFRAALFPRNGIQG